MAYVFVSYAREDKGRAKAIVDALQSIGADVWIDVADLPMNGDISAVLDSKIRGARAVLVLWSQRSNSSTWVRAEAFRALELGTYCGALLEPFSPPVPFNAHNAPDLSDWTGSTEHAGWNRLVRDMFSAPEDASILGEFNARQALEAADRQRQLEGTQEQLPFGDENEPGSIEPQVYDDVDALVQAASDILSSAQRLDLTNAVVRTSLEAELVRRAACVVASSREEVAKLGVSSPVFTSIQAAIDQCDDGDLIVVCRGRYTECLKVSQRVRIVGLGAINDRPLIVASANQDAIQLGGFSRIENLVIETRQKRPAIRFVNGRPVVLRCTVSRFSGNDGEQDGALYVAGQASPIVVASSVTTADATGVYSVHLSGGRFLGAAIYTARGSGVVCRGRPHFEGCSIEAVGRPAVQVLTTGHPVFGDCQISGRGAPVVVVKGSARPRIHDSRVVAVRQLAFDFGEEAGGRYERNLLSSEGGEDPPPPKPRSFFDRLTRRNTDLERQTEYLSRYIRFSSKRKPLFVANRDDSGTEVNLPF